MDKTKPEIGRLIEEIRAYVNSADRSNSPQVQPLAAEYAKECRSVNDRLDRCGDLLARGHRPEAIALAEAEPALLELVSLLAFPEVDQWQEEVGNYGWERAPALKLDVANSINEAYALEAQLGELLKENRLLAMQEAPVHQRLGLLRRIAATDVTTPFWQDDVVAFEQQFVKELATVGRAMLNSNDQAAIEEFATKYEREPWTATPAELLRTVYQSAVEKISFEQTLPDIANQLDKAYRNRDINALQKLRENWQHAVGRLTNSGSAKRLPAEFSNRVGPIFEQLDLVAEQTRQFAFMRDVQELVNGMARGDALEKIDVLVATAESHGISLPKEVLADLAAYRRGELQAKATSTLLVVISVFAVVVFMGLFYLMFQFVATQK